jgi:predicted Holliday junction resolvase-like endonuclease
VADLLIAALLGAGAGLVVTEVLLRRSAVARARDRFEAWQADQRAGIRHTALVSSRGGIKAEVALGLADVLGDLPFEASDVRFVGDPVTFVVFDGHAEVMDRAAPTLRGVSFVTVGGTAGGHDPGLLVAECVAGARVEWMTLHLP